MSLTNVSTPNGSTSFLGLLAIVFITLKLCNVINWSWWWVAAPVWGAIVLGVGIGILAFIVDIIHIPFKR